jgi:hypothetical protein
MKKLATITCSFLLAIGVVMAQTEPQEAAVDNNGPQITFEEMEFDFGDIHQGEQVEHTFKFKNTGNSALILNNVLTTCGCTAPEWPKEPIAAGAESQIIVRFNSQGKTGRQNKVITIQSNIAGSTTRIKIMGMVLPPVQETGSN